MLDGFATITRASGDLRERAVTVQPELAHATANAVAALDVLPCAALMGGLPSRAVSQTFDVAFAQYPAVIGYHRAVAARTDCGCPRMCYMFAATVFEALVDLWATAEGYTRHPEHFSLRLVDNAYKLIGDLAAALRYDEPVYALDLRPEPRPSRGAACDQRSTAIGCCAAGNCNAGYDDATTTTVEDLEEDYDDEEVGIRVCCYEGCARCDNTGVLYP
ncbi:hypothetical protein AB0M43_23930 [Longispora sp. NPDC051575]|uniref:hypothetical protein n=1 Tax=Longispora sp. NPDC051575 TaxID=3154943 RepID=UPI00341EA353